MSLTVNWLRVDLRRRWRTLGVLVLLVAISAGTVLTAVAGARRGSSAVDRLLAVSQPATAVVHVNHEGDNTKGWAAVRDLPEVMAVSTFTLYSGFGVDEAPGDPVLAYIPTDAEEMRTIERPVVLTGRLANPATPDEAVVTAQFVRSFGRGVGDVVTVRLFSVQQVEGEPGRNGVTGVHNLPFPRPDGPAVRVRIVGVVRSPWFSDSVGDRGRLIPSPALAATYSQNVVGRIPNSQQSALVRLGNGDSDLSRLREDLAAIPGWSGAEVISRSPVISHARDVGRFESGCLLAFALAALVTALVLVGQVIARHTAAELADLQVLRALGMTDRQGVLAAAAGPVLASVLGALAGVVGAALASRWMPFGAASMMEPTPGIDVDWVVFIAGALVTTLLAAAMAAGSAWLARETRVVRLPVRSSSIARAALRWGLPVPITLGTRFALEPDHGVGAAPIRSALAAAVAGVLGVVAVGTFAAGAREAADHPARFGQPDQITVALGLLGNDNADPADVTRALRADPDVATVLDTPYSVTDTGAGTVLTFSTDPGSQAQPVMITGRPPALPTEMALAPQTADRLHAGIDSLVTWHGDTGTPKRLRVTGIALVPQTAFNEYDNGAWVTAQAYPTLFKGFLLHELRVRLRAGADVNAVAKRYRAATAGIAGSQMTFISQSPRPGRLAEVRDLEVLPLILGGFLAVLGIGAVGNALGSSVRSRRRDIAVLRALGMTPRQARGVTVTHAGVLAAIGLVFGLPLGVALGRVIWSQVAGSTPLVYLPPTAVGLLLVTVPGAVLAGQLLALPAGSRSARLRPAEVLRAD